jgi:hypothetical protein
MACAHPRNHLNLLDQIADGLQVKMAAVPRNHLDFTY